MKGDFRLLTGEFTSQLQFESLFILNGAGRITSTRALRSSPGPMFSLVRSTTSCAWGVGTRVPDQLAAELDGLARQEPPVADPHDDPVHAERYVSMLGGKVWSGPAFTFPALSNQRFDDVVLVEHPRLLERNFPAWTTYEIDGQSPVIAVVRDGQAVSVCFCATQSDAAAQAGLETAPEYRGHGFGPSATVAWASAVRASGRMPFYSTLWSNEASLAVARKLRLIPFATDWGISVIDDRS